jgi:sec-independent protein translocase protein TatA
MFGIGLPELIIVLVIVLVLFGAGRIPGVMKDLGKGVSSFKDGLKGEVKAPEKKSVAKKSSAKKKTSRKPTPKKRRK